MDQHPEPPLVQPIQGATEQHNLETLKWSGAVNDRLPAGYKFTSVAASWTVSRPHPQNWAWQTWGWDDAKFSAATWVGIDGHKDSHDKQKDKKIDILQAGTAQKCITSTHQDTKYVTYPWWEWFTGPPYEISGFEVRPGDLVSVHVSSDLESDTKGHVFFCNESACTYTSFGVTAPKGVSLERNCVEWIVEAHRPEKDHPTMSYLGATFLYDCHALAEKRQGNAPPRYLSKDLSDATLMNIVQDGITLSTAQKENDTVLGIFGETRTEFTQIPYVAKK
jgi:hypothetical protein